MSCLSGVRGVRGSAREVESSLRGSALWEAPESRGSSCTTSAVFLAFGAEEDDGEAAESRDSYDDRKIAEPQAGVMFALLFLCVAPMTRAAVGQHGEGRPAVVHGSADPYAKR